MNARRHPSVLALKWFIAAPVVRYLEASVLYSYQSTVYLCLVTSSVSQEKYGQRNRFLL